MPHIIFEYTDNIKNEINFHSLFKSIHQVFMKRKDLFPIGGIRSRAIELNNYFVADGTEDDAFVHATIKIGAGRSENVKKEICEEIFAIMKEHFAELYEKRYVALSLELYEFSKFGTYKHNNIHQRYQIR